MPYCAREPITSAFVLHALHGCLPSRPPFHSCSARSLSRLEPKCMSHHSGISKLLQDICDALESPIKRHGDCTRRRSSSTGELLSRRLCAAVESVTESDFTRAAHQFSLLFSSGAHSIVIGLSVSITCEGHSVSSFHSRPVSFTSSFQDLLWPNQDQRTRCLSHCRVNCQTLES